MFTGIISAIGRIDDIQKPGDWRLKITTPWDCAKIDLGASIACSGVCLTVVERDADWFAVEVSAESLSRTTIGTWQAGTQINLERALRLGDELGGHIVSGHVDGLAIIEQITRSGDSHELKISVPDALSKFIAEKGSVSLPITIQEYLSRLQVFTSYRNHVARYFKNPYAKIVIERLGVWL